MKNFIKNNITKMLVSLFIIVLIIASFDAYSEVNDNGPRVSLGHTFNHTSTTYSEIGYEYNNFEITAAQRGTENPHSNPVTYFSLSNIVRPGWSFYNFDYYQRIGISYNDGEIKHSSHKERPIIGQSNFRLGVGLEYKTFQLELFHYSSANTHIPNSGVDGLQIRYKIPVN